MVIAYPRYALRDASSSMGVVVGIEIGIRMVEFGFWRVGYAGLMR